MLYDFDSLNRNAHVTDSFESLTTLAVMYDFDSLRRTDS